MLIGAMLQISKHPKMKQAQKAIRICLFKLRRFTSGQNWRLDAADSCFPVFHYYYYTAQ